MSNITVGELKEMLDSYDSSLKVSFSGLDFYRLKQRSDKVLQVEFDQVVYKDTDGNIKIDNIN